DRDKLVDEFAIALFTALAVVPLRAVFETLGMHDVVAKSTGSSNPYNMVRATFDALKHKVHPKDIAAQRGIKYATMQARRGASGNASEE
ncbi:hypothetical protein ACC763_38130, partial [Rhizobium ruizarguesonis]